MSSSDYQNLVVWKKARVLASDVYRATMSFPRAEMFGLTQQMRRAAISIACNIAEGHGRRSTGDRVQFLCVARGSVLELETQTVIAGDLKFLSESEAAELVDRA